MHLTNTSMAQQTKMAEMMNALTAIQQKMSIVRSTFPNYYQQLQLTYNQMLLSAKHENMTPPWMTK